MISSLHFEITHDCNFNCAHCYNKKQPATLDKGTIDMLVDKIQNVPEVCVTGGEPFMVRDLLFTP